MTDTRDVLQRIEREKAQYLAELKDYIRIASISTDPRLQAATSGAAPIGCWRG